MTESLLRSLRDRLLDESEPLAGLLRVCLLLGAETGSTSLREWARSELFGYGEDAEVPAYRLIPAGTIKMGSISGYTVSTGQIVNKFELPSEAIEYVPEQLQVRQSVEELETLAAAQTLAFGHGGLAYAQAVWNQKLDEYQQITSLHFEISGAAIVGVLGKIRSQLVEVVADLTADTPLTELPRKEQVDAAVGQHIGTQYNTTIQAANGPTAIGTNATATQAGLTLAEALQLLDAVRVASDAVTDLQDRAELLAAVEDLKGEVASEHADTGAVVKKVGRLKAIALRIGIPALSSVVGGAAEALTSMAVGGAFG